MTPRFCRPLLMTLVALAMLVAAPGAPLAGTEHAAERTGSSKPAPVDLNRASVEELMALPGIGKVTAERIVAFRDEHGPFTRVEDLMKVKGIGEKSFQKLRDRVTVSKGR